MSAATHWKGIGGAFLVTLVLFLAVALISKRAGADISPQPLQTAAWVEGIRVHRFRDGPRVCYVMVTRKGGHAAGAEASISCVVSP